jgi:transcriptional regulator with XRE-family HTH domain
MSLSRTLPQCADVRQYLCKNVGVENIGDAWHIATAERIGRAVAKSRKDLGMTAQQLAERCKDLGAPIHRTTITKIENGRARFDVGELLILAAALHVPPVVLLYPDLPDGDVEIIPGRPANSWTAYLWAAGMAPSFMNPSSSSRGEQLIDAVRRRWELMLRLGSLKVQISTAANNAPLQESLKQEESRVRSEIGWLNALIRDVGGSVKDA